MSHLEDRFHRNLKLKKLVAGLETQYRFHPVRRWKMDFAWPELLLAVEIQGGTYSRKRSGHTTGTGTQRDYEKNNAAVLLGWQVLYFSSKDLKVPYLQVTMETTKLALSHKGYN